MSILKLELYRAFRSKKFQTGLILGCIISVAHFIVRVLSLSGNIAVDNNMDYPYSLYNSCMMLDYGGFFCKLYLYAVIIIATLPFGMSYAEDKEDGYIKNIAIRTKKVWYLLSKYVAVFLSGLVLCILPLILNVFLTATVTPALKPQVGTGLFTIFEKCMFADIFYRHPMVYLIVYMFIDGIVAGLFACMALVVTNICTNRYIVLIAPFAIFVLLQNCLPYILPMSALPYDIMYPAQIIGMNGYTVAAEIVILFVISFVGHMIGGLKKDVL